MANNITKHGQNIERRRLRYLVFCASAIGEHDQMANPNTSSKSHEGNTNDFKLDTMASRLKLSIESIAQENGADELQEYLSGQLK